MCTYRELNGLPAYGPSPISFSSTGQGKHQEGYVVEFLPDSDDAWIGNFQSGIGHLDAVGRHPDGRKLIVVAGGAAYILDPVKKHVVDAFGSQIDYIRLLDDTGMVVLSNGLWFELIRRDGSRRHTARISWDGMRNIKIQDHLLVGEAYSPISDTWATFSLDLTDLTIKGGSYPVDRT